MTFRFLPAVALALAPAPLLAQVPAQAPARADADLLADQVRRIGANPTDLDALLAAGDLEVRLDDLAAATVFYARAQKVSATDPRLAAGEGAILVRSERPAEALRRFADAERGGVPLARFASDRGLAYDLLGDPGRAQQDYRAALAAAPDAETQRRYALSLGIAGRQARALAVLDPLTRADDRAAWRARAFVLAMAGDQAEASRIAATMMPPGAAAGLADFFRQLPTLPAADRAFAVHFGEVHPTPARLADARLAPAQAPLAIEPEPVRVAAVVPAPAPDKGKHRRDKHAPVPVAVAVAVATPPATQPPAYQAPTYTAPPTYQAPALAAVSDRPLSEGEQRSLAAAGLRTPAARRGGRAVPGFVVPAAPIRALTEAEQASLAAASAPRGRPGRIERVATVAPAPVVTVPVPAMAASPTPARIAPDVTDHVLTAAEQVSLAAATGHRGPLPRPGFETASTDTPASPAPAVPRAEPSPEVVASTPPVVLIPPPAVVVATAPAPRLPRTLSRGHAQADTILARIVAGLSIPASELGVSEQPGSRRNRAARAAEVSPGSDDPAVAHAAAKQAASDRRAAAAKLVADRKAAADKKAAAEQEAADRKAARAEPSRIWVQVAGGANEASLPSAWAVTKAKAPAAFAGHKAWTTPLRATNRVLTGPFKTDAEARAYVNQLAKSGVPAFTFTSDAGQKVSRLETK